MLRIICTYCPKKRGFNPINVRSNVDIKRFKTQHNILEFVKIVKTKGKKYGKKS